MRLVELLVKLGGTEMSKSLPITRIGRLFLVKGENNERKIRGDKKAG